MNNEIGRNDPCPCNSGKKYKNCCMAINTQNSPITFADEEGLHVIRKGEKPTPSEIENMTKEYQNQIRNSPIWNEMVSKYGLTKAENLLKEFKAKVN